jgi:hypothetical protein
MNKYFAIYLWVTGVAWTALCAPFPDIPTIHRFYGDGYQAVVGDMPADRVSECAVPAKFLNRRSVFSTIVRKLSEASAYQETITTNFFFWRRRSFETACSLEKHFHENQFALFTNTLHWVQSDFGTISRDHESTFYFGVYAECVLMTLIRLQEEKVPQRDWLTQQRLNEAFATRNLYRTPYFYRGRTAKKYVTVMTLMLIGNRIAEYEKENGVLPRSLAEMRLPDELYVDAWERPIAYTRTDGRWFLQSLGENGVASGVDIDNNFPFFQYNSSGNLVLFSGFINVQSEYYKTGSLKLGRFSFTRSPKTGAPSTSTYAHGELRELW